MTRTRLLNIVLLLSLASPSLRGESSTTPSTTRVPHLRTTNRRLHSVILEGLRSSPTFEALVDRLRASDVIVFIEDDRHPVAGIAGRMTFLTSAGGYRYLVVRVVYQPRLCHQVAILGHELQHAVEVADAPAIVNASSLAREYARFGREEMGRVGIGRRFDTDAAVRTGSRVMREMLTRRSRESPRIGNARSSELTTACALDGCASPDAHDPQETLAADATSVVGIEAASDRVVGTSGER